MPVKQFVFLVVGFLAAFATLCSAASPNVGTFTCPSGQTEDLQCAASCCQQYGGTYLYSDESCEVASTTAWNQAAQCEQQSNCCVSQGVSAPGSTSSGCCGPAFLIGAVAVGAVAVSRIKK